MVEVYGVEVDAMSRADPPGLRSIFVYPYELGWRDVSQDHYVAVAIDPDITIGINQRLDVEGVKLHNDVFIWVLTAGGPSQRVIRGEHGQGDSSIPATFDSLSQYVFQFVFLTCVEKSSGL